MDTLSEDIIKDLGCELDPEIQMGNSRLYDGKFYRLQKGMYITNYDLILNKPVKEGMWMIFGVRFHFYVSEDALNEPSGRIVIRNGIERIKEKIKQNSDIPPDIAI